jgi:chloride channel, nucleotide-sensitive, 1A
MQIEIPDDGGNDEPSSLQLTIITPLPIATSESNGSGSKTHTQQLYDAISACSDLHPDPFVEDEDDEDGVDRIIFEHDAVEGFNGVLRGASDGGLPPPMPGSSGWITAENVHEFFDEEGNWIGDEEDEEGGELGEGAGRVRGRDEVEEDGTNGHGPAADTDTKRPRVD